MTARQENSYDQIPYPKMSYRDSHPRHLEAMATLFGMEPPPVPRCRVLELGCAAGWNLIPQAQGFPDSRFLGIDSSARQVADAQSTIDALRLENIEFRHAGIMDVDASWGPFDYITCYGVYSWVTPELQDKILTICRENLASNGVAVVSYNTYPGWHFRGLIRDMMQYHVCQFDEPGRIIAQARALLDFLAANCSEKTAYGKMLKDELNVVRKSEDGYLFHEYMEQENHPVYFHEFIRRIEAKGLQYLADTNFSAMLPKFLSAAARMALKDTPLLTQQQYMDFLRNNSFRKTLLCAKEVTLTRVLHSGSLAKFHLALSDEPEPARFDVGGEQPVQIRTKSGQITAGAPLGKASLAHLIDVWPETIRLDQLHAASLERLGSDPSRAAAEGMGKEALASGLMGAFSGGVLDLFVHPPQLTPQVAARPVASPLARWQAANGNLVTNQRHETLRLDDFSCHVLRRLDGHNGRDSLLDGIREAVASGQLTPTKDGRQVVEVDWELAASTLDHVLTRLGHSGFLIV